MKIQGYPRKSQLQLGIYRGGECVSSSPATSIPSISLHFPIQLHLLISRSASVTIFDNLQMRFFFSLPWYALKFHDGKLIEF